MKKAVKFSIPLHYVFMIHALVLTGVITQSTIVSWSHWLVFKLIGFGLVLDVFGIIMLSLIFSKAVPPNNVKKIPPPPSIHKNMIGSVINGAILGVFLYKHEYGLSILYSIHIISTFIMAMLGFKIYNKLFVNKSQSNNETT